MRSILVSLALLIALPSTTLAQGTATVSVADLTVADQRPPDRYRDLLATGLRPTLGPVLECYRERLARTPALQGTLRLRLWVSARQVIRATEEASTLGDDTFDECARARVREFRLPDAAPDGGAMVRFTLYFTRTGVTGGALAIPGDVFATLDGTVPPPSAAPVTPPTPPVTTTTPTTPPPATSRATVRVDTARGALTTDQIAGAIPATTFDGCTAASGELPINLFIARDGRPSATRGRGTLRDGATIQCVMRALRAVRFPTARRSTRATLTITIAQ
ncbi:hypothetical protein [Sandaracinus amylolyticus]|uniref:TonB C-terminal domain-containing protein n=1 Tax=Sandaracinus amylolyticus TaxID=927083 RepID=A0A0F6YMM7_9BACT|nr:hypothetical protein [Sandaracinus amylolyticus]AKF11210.1 hypothetical protein DB32_008359 [Sandaracinus amylolyticus]